MYKVQEIIEMLEQQGIDLYTGVPCSILKPAIEYCSNEKNYYSLNNEGECIAFACGSYMAGKHPAIFMQNSGLGNAVNPLTSLVYPYKFPFLILIGWRGQPNTSDEPQHTLMGSITASLLEQMRIGYDVLEGNIEDKVKRAFTYMRDHSLPYAFLVKKDTFEPYTEVSHYDMIHYETQGFPSREQVIQLILNLINDNHIIISTTGYTSRDLYSCENRENNFYMVGSMGCAVSLALGLSLHSKNKKFIVLDGDGSMLMRLEGKTSVGHYKPDNLIHIILDNNAYESTGGQKTISNTVNFVQIALACGYSKALTINNLSELSSLLSNELQKEEGPLLLHIRISNFTSELPRVGIKPEQVKKNIELYLLHNQL